MAQFLIFTTGTKVHFADDIYDGRDFHPISGTGIVKAETGLCGDRGYQVEIIDSPNFKAGEWVACRAASLVEATA